MSASQPNPHRGEVCLTINGTPRLMRLSLGALAGLEARLETGSLIELAERFENGQVSSNDLIALIAAGLAGAETPLSEAEIADAEVDGGAVAAMRAGVALLAAAFGTGTAAG